MRASVLTSVAWIGLAACGRFGFDGEVRPDGAIADAEADAAIDGAPVTYCDWSAGPPFTSSALPRTELFAADTQYDPFLVGGDPLTINYVTRASGSGDLYEAHRPSETAPFGTPVVRSDLGGPTTEEAALALERGGLHGYFVFFTGGTGDIYEVGRGSLGDPLAVLRQLTELGTTGDRYDVWPFADGLGLAYVDEQVAAPNKIMFASRATTNDPWSGFVESAFNATFPGLSGPSLTANGLVMVFSAPGLGGEDDIFYSTRPDLTAAFAAPQLLAVANSPSGDHEPSLRDDGCELFLARDTGVSTKWDIYSVPAVAP